MACCYRRADRIGLPPRSGVHMRILSRAGQLRTHGRLVVEQSDHSELVVLSAIVVAVRHLGIGKQHHPSWRDAVPSLRKSVCPLRQPPQQLRGTKDHDRTTRLLIHDRLRPIVCRPPFSTPGRHHPASLKMLQRLRAVGVHFNQRMSQHQRPDTVQYRPLTSAHHAGCGRSAHRTTGLWGVAANSRNRAPAGTATTASCSVRSEGGCSRYPIFCIAGRKSALRLT